MKRKQYIIQARGIDKREELFNYLVSKYKLKGFLTREYMINSVFPFVLDLSKNELWVCESISSLACAAQQHRIMSLEEFYSSQNSDNKIL